MDAGDARSRWATPTPTNFRYLNHFFETDQAQSVDELDEILKRNQGIPWVNTLAADSSGKAYYADISVVPNVSDAKATVCNTPLGARHLRRRSRLPVLDGSRSLVRVGQRPRRGRARHLRAVAHAEPVPRRLRRELERQLLAVESRAAADRLRDASSATRTPSARCARASGLVMIEERLAGTRRLAGQPLHAPAAPGHGLRQPPVRGRAVARRARADCATRTPRCRARAARWT